MSKNMLSQTPREKIISARARVKRKGAPFALESSLGSRSASSPRLATESASSCSCCALLKSSRPETTKMTMKNEV